VGGAFLQFATGVPGGVCGASLNASNTVIKNLTCGGLNIGGGSSLVGEGPTPDGSISLFALTCAAGGGACNNSCSGSLCNIGPTSTAPLLNSTTPDCSNTGCNFGTPLPIPNPTLPTLSTCALNTFASPVSGSVNISTGQSQTTVALSSDVYLTGNLNQPCPKCSAVFPASGTCDRGPRAGLTCVAVSSTGYTRDCPTGGVGTVATPCPAAQPGNGNCCSPASSCNCPCTAGGGNCCDGSHVGAISVTLSPLGTTGASATNASGVFCTSQAHAGCFGSAACRTINETGSSGGTLLTNVTSNATLASVFCIPATGNGLVDASADLPGPGAVSLPGIYEAHN
jgi:hypothetical protein